MNNLSHDNSVLLSFCDTQSSVYPTGNYTLKTR